MKSKQVLRNEMECSDKLGLSAPIDEHELLEQEDFRWLADVGNAMYFWSSRLDDSDERSFIRTGKLIRSL